MEISINWVKEYITVEATDAELDEKLTKSGLEVEGVNTFESIKGGLKGIVIGEVLTCEQHPNADKLSKTTVDIGLDTPAPIVCGAPNVAAGQKVVVATLGTTIYTPEGDSFKIKKAKIRGEVSEGMMCAEDELGLGNAHDGIMVLDTDLPNGTPAADYFDIQNDTILEIGLTPNRADAASHFGVARELQALYPSQKATLPDTSQFKEGSEQSIDVVVDNEEACPRYAGLLIDNINVEDSPQWLQNRLKSIGLTPINNIVDITNYVLHGLGQPMHAFDADKISSNKIVVKTLPEGTPFVTLDDEKRTLKATDLMICNDDSPMCLAGVFGGAESGVTTTTTRIFLESAYFNPSVVRKSSLTHTLKTDASFRFERGTNPDMVVEALKHAALLIEELAGGKVTSPIYDLYPTPIKPFEFEVKLSHVDRLIGKSIGEDRIKEILTALEIAFTQEGDSLHVSVPPYRVDVQREADVIEEILRIYGYDNIALSDHLSSNFIAPEAQANKVDQTKRIIGSALAGNGYFEIITNSLTNPSYAEKSNAINENEGVPILNKLSDELGVMRQSIMHAGLEIIAYNCNRKEKDLKLFEFAKEYSKIEGEYVEVEKLAIFLTGNENGESWAKPTTATAFSSLGDTITGLLEKLNISTTKTSEISDDRFAKGIQIELNNNVIGKAGIIAPKHLKTCEVKQQVYYAEFNLKTIALRKKNKLQFEELSKFPRVRRDLSLVLDQKTSYQEIKSIAQKVEKKLLKEVNVFDIYDGEQIEAGKKSYSVYFMLQDNHQTLTDKVIDKTMNKLMTAFERDLGAVIRK